MSTVIEKLQEILNAVQGTQAIVNLNIEYRLGGEAIPTDPDDPGDPGVIIHTITPRENGSFPVYRTPTTEDKNKLRLVLIGGQQVVEKTPPMKIHRSPVWSTDQDLYNVMANWAWLPRQMVVKNNNKAVLLPTDFIPESDEEIIWQGCFVERKYLGGTL